MIDVLAEGALTSKTSVVRAQLVVSHALTRGMDDVALTGMKSTTEECVIIKRLWDETAMRLQLTVDNLQRMFPQAFAHSLIETHNRSNNIYPGFLVQSMQQSGFVRFGSNDEASGHLIIPGKLVSSTASPAIWNAVNTSCGCLALDELREICKLVRCVLQYSFPDGAPSNKVCLAALAQALPDLLPWDGHCGAHLLHLIWRVATKPLGFDNPLYCMSRLMAGTGNAAKIGKAWETEAKQCPVRRGTPPPPDHGFNEMVLQHTVFRACKTQSYLKRPGTDRHDAETLARLRERCEADANILRKGFNAPWYLPDPVHWCWDPDGFGQRCCRTIMETRELLVSGANVLSNYTFAGLQGLIPARWQSLSRVATKFSLPSLLHNMAKRGLKRTLLTPAQLLKVRRDLQRDAAAAAPAADGLPAPEANDVAAAWRILTGKRTLATDTFVSDRLTPIRFLAIIVGTVPLDVLYHTMEDAEAWAVERHGKADAHPVGFLQTMAADHGLLTWIHEELAKPVMEEDSPFHFIVQMSENLDADPERCCRDLRGQQIRLSAGCYRRYVLLFRRKPWSLIRMLGMDEEQQLQETREMCEGGGCPRCRSLFVVRLGRRLSEDPPLTLEDKRKLIVKLLHSTAEDPQVFSMQPLERLHSDAKIACSRSMTRRKKLPTTLFASQSLTRWGSVHRSRMGKKYKPIPTVKAVIKQTANVKTFKAVRKRGYDVFRTKRLKEQRVAAEAAGKLWDYMAESQKIVAEWSGSLTEVEKKRFSAEADVQANALNAASDSSLISGDDCVDPEGMMNTDLGTPWGLGSRSTPCSAPHLAKILEELAVDGKMWLRELYQTIRGDVKSTSIGCPVVQEELELNVAEAAKFRLQNLTCDEVTPGLCRTHPQCTAIKRLARHLVKEVKSIISSHQGTCEGELLVAFVQRNKRQVGNLPADELGSQTATIAFLADQIDKRKSWMTFTLCKQPSVVHFPFDVEMDCTDRHAFKELTDFELATQLHEGLPHDSVICTRKLHYKDYPSRLRSLKIIGASDVIPAPGKTQVVPDTAADDEFELLWDSVTAPFKPDEAGKHSKGASDSESVSSDNSVEAIKHLQSDSEVEVSDLEEIVVQKQKKKARKVTAPASGSASSSSASSVTLTSPDFSKVGDNVLWKGKRIGRITTWRQNLSCVCSIHRSCRTPAGSLASAPALDEFAAWLLKGIHPDESTRITQADHKRLAQEFLRGRRRP